MDAERVAVIRAKHADHGDCPGPAKCDKAVLLAALDRVAAERDELRAETEARAAEILRLRDEADWPKCLYCSFGEAQRRTHEELEQHIRQDCQRHPLRAVERERDEARATARGLRTALETHECPLGPCVVWCAQHGVYHPEAIDVAVRESIRP